MFKRKVSVMSEEWVDSELWVMASAELEKELEDEEDETNRRTDDENDNEGDRNTGPLL